METEVIPVLAHVHKLTKVEAKKVTCTEDGNKEYYVCSGCKKLFADADAAKEINKEDAVVKATGHKAEKIAGKEATCTEDGLTEGSKCSVCGEILEKQEVIKASGHKAKKIAGKAATCTEDGLTEGSKCSVCGEILKKQEVIKATGHKWSAWEVTKEASETEEGSRRRVCENNKTHVETEVIPVLAHVHKLTKVEAKKVTCTEDGNKEYYVCSGCKKLFADADAAKEINKEDAVVKATGHKAEKIAGKEATCTEDGLTEGSKCSVCGEILEKQEVIKATGHKWSAWEVTKEASETEEGSRRRVCENDKTHVETEVIPVLAHVHKLTKVEAKKATCTEDGNKEYYVCSGCKKLFADADAVEEINKEDTVVKATGHKAEKIAGKEATCTEDGLTEGSKCSVCGEILEKQKVIKATGHKAEKIAGKAATCTEDGLTEESKCSVCGEILEKQEVIKATGHKVVKDSAVPATTTTTGLSEGSHCSVCGKIIVAQKVFPKKDIKGDVNDPISVNGVEKKITANRNDGDIVGSTFKLLQLRAKKTGRNYINLSWTKVKGASGYIIYGNRCNSAGKVYSLKKLVSITRTSTKITKLNKGTYYKYTAVAYKTTKEGQKVIASSKTIHVATTGGKVGNYKKVKLNKKVVKLKCGNIFKIKAEQIPEKKKLKVNKHRGICFESSAPSIATVSSSGKVKAKKKGTCVIYIYSQSGTFNKMTVKVK